MHNYMSVADDPGESEEVNLAKWMQDNAGGLGISSGSAHHAPQPPEIAMRALNISVGTSDSTDGLRTNSSSVDDQGEPEVNLAKWLQENAEGMGGLINIRSAAHTAPEPPETPLARTKTPEISAPEPPERARARAKTPDSSSSVEGSESDDDSSDESDGSAADGAEGGAGADDGFFTCPASELKGVVLGAKYRMVRELGKGTFGRVMECYEIDQSKMLERVGLGHWRGTFSPKTSALYAVKIIRNDAQSIRDAEIEADMLRKINRRGGRGVELFPIIFEVFDLPTGSKCFVLEKCGMSLYDVIRKNEGGGFAIHYVREISIQLFDALDFLHKRGLIHTDIKPENILFVENSANEQTARIKVIDFGSAVFSKDSKGDAQTSIVNTRQYRAPEILLRVGWGFPSDIWAAGCTIAELTLGYQLFPAKNSTEHLAMIEKRIGGRFPRRMLTHAGPIATKCFDRASGKHLRERVLQSDSLEYLENECHPLEEELGEEAVASGLCDLLSDVLTLDPQLRPRAKKALALAKRIISDDESSDDD